MKFVTKHQSAERPAGLTAAMTLRPARMDLTGAAKQPLFCPRPSASSAVLSPSLCAFHAAPSLSAAECHPRPLPVRFIKPVGDEMKAWRQLFSPASLFQTRDLVHRLQDGATLYGASDISGCLPHSSSSGPRNYTDVRTQKAGNEMIWKKKVFGLRLVFRFAIRGHLFLLKHFTQWLWSQQAFS